MAEFHQAIRSSGVWLVATSADGAVPYSVWGALLDTGQAEGEDMTMQNMWVIWTSGSVNQQHAFCLHGHVSSCSSVSWGVTCGSSLLDIFTISVYNSKYVRTYSIYSVCNQSAMRIGLWAWHLSNDLWHVRACTHYFLLPRLIVLST